jgi:hypothetical protein
LVVRLPDTDTVVEIWETDNTDENPNGFTLIGEWPFEPKAVIVNRTEKRVRLAPGNYWLFAKKDGKSLERRLLKIGWGGTQTVAIGAAGRADLQRLQGKWSAVSVRYLGGPELGAAALPLSGVTFTGNRMRILLPGLDTASVASVGSSSTDSRMTSFISPGGSRRHRSRTSGGVPRGCRCLRPSMTVLKSCYGGHRRLGRCQRRYWTAAGSSSPPRCMASQLRPPTTR